jgi:hypothetical protein
MISATDAGLSSFFNDFRPVIGYSIASFVTMANNLLNNAADSSLLQRNL